MKVNFSLSVLTPCSENWKNFTPTPTGGFCGHCSKNVVDFTRLSENDIQAFFNQKPAHVCGRFYPQQLKLYTQDTTTLRPGFFLLKAGIAAALVLLISKPMVAQTASRNSQIETVETHKDNVALNMLKKLLIKGKVVSEEGTPIIGVAIVQRNTDIGTTTNSEGEFELNVDFSKDNTLVVSFIGYRTEEYAIAYNTERLNITLQEEHYVLGEVMYITGEVSSDEPFTQRQPFFRRVWSTLKNIF